MTTFNEELQQFKAMIDSANLSDMEPAVRDAFKKLSKQIEDGSDKQTITKTLVECLTVAKAPMSGRFDGYFKDATEEARKTVEKVTGVGEDMHDQLMIALHDQQMVQNMSPEEQLLAFATPLSAIMTISKKADRTALGHLVNEMTGRPNDFKLYFNKRWAEAMDRCLKECFEAIQRCWSEIDAAESEKRKPQNK